MNIILEKMISAPRIIKRIITYIVDLGIHIFAYLLSLYLTFQSLNIDLVNNDLFIHASLSIATSVLLLIILGFYRAVNRFVSFKILLVVALGCSLSCIAYYSIGKGMSASYVTGSSTVIYGSVLCILLGGSRLLVRSYFSMRFNTQKEKIVIYGAGSAGRQLATSLITGNEYYPVAFVDDDESLDGVIIQGIRVHKASNLREVIKTHSAGKVLLALPSTSRARRKFIIGRIEGSGVAVQTIPGMADIVAGKMKIDEFQDVDIEDLLGRDPVPPVKKLLDKNIANKSIMITGAGGSIGSELCRQIVQLKPSTLVLFEISEYGLYQIDKELAGYCQQHSLKVDIKPVLGSVVDKRKVEKVLQHFKVETLYHAAAYKHVPMVEHNVIEGVRNNVFGTLNTALAAIESGVQSFVLISTDKAVRPTNVMGTTKRLAELVLQGLATKNTSTCFSMVRFGNVLGSSGSVVPLFKKQIQGGGPVTVTHPDITRYFMTIPEAAQLVIQAGAMGKGGDVFVLDMGEPVKIVELAEKLILLMGLQVKSADNPNGDIEIAYSGLRPGEKLYEELLVGSNVEGTTHPRIMTANEKYLEWIDINELIKNLDSACNQYDQVRIREILLEAPTDFKPSDGISDLLWEADRNNRENVVKISEK
ncbi:polysaccharide biosynthesis protein [Kangiella geojedonensis]|uniref:Polysaccharide biosynthesis protein n=1 Tax=Kangiella geojedonensis TaxID=914150 RepID=A0A0F6RCU9_9GAMM|nr:nucleoside-diphosphate sugar epimerase/dehydratase [Kangiella geojedonensis]AKE52336.1 Polysaccharide biosynthesis protein [Kangiella geojedonensis]